MEAELRFFFPKKAESSVEFKAWQSPVLSQWRCKKKDDVGGFSSVTGAGDKQKSETQEH